MAEGNGGPTLGEVSRRINELSQRVGQLDSKIERYADMAVGARLSDIDRRLEVIERTMTTGANQRSSATWQALFLVLSMIASMAGGIALSAVLK
jgi:hypothetical protein